MRPEHLQSSLALAGVLALAASVAFVLAVVEVGATLAFAELLLLPLRHQIVVVAWDRRAIHA